MLTRNMKNSKCARECQPVISHRQLGCRINHGRRRQGHGDLPNASCRRTQVPWSKMNLLSRANKTSRGDAPGYSWVLEKDLGAARPRHSVRERWSFLFSTRRYFPPSSPSCVALHCPGNLMNLINWIKSRSLFAIPLTTDEPPYSCCPEV